MMPWKPVSLSKTGFDCSMMFSFTVNHLMHDEGKTTTGLLTDSLENVPRIMSDINLVPTDRCLKLFEELSISFKCMNALST